MDEIRRQLAELMETVESSTSSSKKRSFTDLDVCKYYLTGLCPHDLFQNTKQYLGECRNIHSDDLREQYQQARQKANYGYEEMTARYLRPHIDDCDRRVARQTLGGRCDTQEKASESIEASAKREVDALEAQIAAKMKEAEELGNRGDVEGSMKSMDEMNQLNVKKNRALEEKSSKVEEAKNMYFQKLRPCDACGALLSEKDGENRLNEHFLGRIHLGFEAVRKHLKELDEYIASTAMKLPRDAAYNCRPSSSAPIRRSESIDSGPPPRMASSFRHSDSYNSGHRDGPNHRGEYSRSQRYNEPKRYSRGEDSYQKESSSNRPRYRDDYGNRRSDDRYRQQQGFGHPDSRYNRHQQPHHSRSSRDYDKPRNDYHRRDSWKGSDGGSSAHASSSTAEILSSTPAGDTRDERGDRRKRDPRSRSRSGESRHRHSKRRTRSRSRSDGDKRQRDSRALRKSESTKLVEHSHSEEVEEGQIDQK